MEGKWPGREKIEKTWGKNKRLCYGRDRATRLSVKFGNYKISLSCGIICMILLLAVFTQYQSVTDTHTHRDGRTDTRRRHVLH